MGQLDQSAADCKKALELNPDDFGGPITLSQIYLMQGRPQDACVKSSTYTTLPTVRGCYDAYVLRAGSEKESDAPLSELITDTMQVMRSRSPRFMLSGTRPTKRSSGLTELILNVIPV